MKLLLKIPSGLVNRVDQDQTAFCNISNLDPVVQSIVSLMSSLVVKMLTVPVSTISNSQIFLLKKCE